MLSLASLLNPAPSGLPASCFPASPVSISPPTPFVDDLIPDENSVPKHKMGKELAGYTKSRAKGLINFCPFENLDDESLRQVRKFRVSPLGSIRDCCRHIPYNSGKKDFYEKTGRESLEVYQYTFKVPGDSSEYTVMWDYNVGLVRMTPFFKCCKYSKTTPAKMLNMNPGLRDITHSITGGSIMAQGYWMPFSCARAVCATFCYHIAGALIPIFGPSFPSECIHPESPDHGRMIIDPTIVAEASRDADLFRRMYAQKSVTTPSSGPKSQRLTLRLPCHDAGGQYERRQRFRKAMIIDSPYATDSDNDIPVGPEFSPAQYQFSPKPPLRTPATAPRWTAVNHLPYHRAENQPPPARSQPFRDEVPYPGANPWLSAVPRFATFGPRRQRAPAPSSHPAPRTETGVIVPLPASPRSPDWGSKRPAEHEHEHGDRGGDADYYPYRPHQQEENDAGESRVGSSPGATAAASAQREDADRYFHRNLLPSLPSLPPLSLPPLLLPGVSGANAIGGTVGYGGGVENNAALLLMNLSKGETKRDRELDRADGEPGGRGGDSGNSMPTPDSVDMHRSKRRKATSI